MMQYEVTVRNLFDAETPEDAVKQMVAWLQDNAAQAGYRVIGDDDTESTFIDAEDLDYDCTNCGVATFTDDDGVLRHNEHEGESCGDLSPDTYAETDTAREVFADSQKDGEQ